MAEGHIHKHLHSMFHLLRKEETLKMVCIFCNIVTINSESCIARLSFSRSHSQQWIVWIPIGQNGSQSLWLTQLFTWAFSHRCTALDTSTIPVWRYRYTSVFCTVPLIWILSSLICGMITPVQQKQKSSEDIMPIVYSILLFAVAAAKQTCLEIHHIYFSPQRVYSGRGG